MGWAGTTAALLHMNYSRIKEDSGSSCEKKSRWDLFSHEKVPPDHRAKTTHNEIQFANIEGTRFFCLIYFFFKILASLFSVNHRVNRGT